MKLLKKAMIYFLSVLLFSFTLAPKAMANSAEPPCLTVVVSFPSDDLTLSIRFADGSSADAVELQKEQKAWEAYYRFFYGMTPARPSLEGAVLIVQSGEKSFECPLPSSAFSQYNNLFTLHVSAEHLAEGQTFGRSLLLIALRIVLTLLIEGLVFFLFGYRKKTSWIAFFIINLITQGALNILLTSSYIESYWIYGYLFYEIIIFMIEIIAFSFILKEKGISKAVLFAFTANAASLVLGGLLLSYLPV